MNARLAHAFLCLLSLAAMTSSLLGCAHEVTVRSEPAGADVYLLDDLGESGTLLGPAPVTLEIDNGSIGGGSTVVVVDERSAVQVDITRGRVTLASFSSAAADMAGGLLCCGGAAAGLGALTFWLWPIVPWLAWPGACLAGCAGFSALLQPLGCACGMWAPPDIVDVNLRTATASSLPGDMVGEVQRVDGPPPLAPPDDDEDGDEDGDGDDNGSDEDEPAPEPRRPYDGEPPLSEGGAIEILYRSPMRF